MAGSRSHLIVVLVGRHSNLVSLTFTTTHGLIFDLSNSDHRKSNTDPSSVRRVGITFPTHLKGTTSGNKDTQLRSVFFDVTRNRLTVLLVSVNKSEKPFLLKYSFRTVLVFPVYFPFHYNGRKKEEKPFYTQENLCTIRSMMKGTRLYFNYKFVLIHDRLEDST